MRQPTVLNPELFKRLQTSAMLKTSVGSIGRTEIRVKDHGQPMLAKEFTDSAGRTRKDIIQWGEMYTLDCPFCGDCRGRMAVSYRFGVQDETNYNGRSLWKCFNENCQSDVENRKKFEQMMQIAALPVLAANLAEEHRALSGINMDQVVVNPTIPQPEEYQSLTALPEGHPIRRMLALRGFDPQVLETNWGCRYTGPRGTLRQRLAVPIYVPDTGGHRLVGYQARYCSPHGEDSPNVFTGPDGRKYTGKLCVCLECNYRQFVNKSVKACTKCRATRLWPIPKWLTTKGVRLDRCLFNAPVAQAERWDYVVVNEGPLDTIRLGSPDDPTRPGPCVSLFKCEISYPYQTLMLFNRWTSRGQPVFLLLDADAYHKAVAIVKHLTEMNEQLGRMVIPVQLPTAGPARLPHEYLWETLRLRAREAGIPCQLTR